MHTLEQTYYVNMCTNWLNINILVFNLHFFKSYIRLQFKRMFGYLVMNVDE